MRFVDRLFEVLGDQQVGWYAARAIGEIGGSDKILTKRNHAKIRVNVLCDPHSAELILLVDPLRSKIFQQHTAKHNARRSVTP